MKYKVGDKVRIISKKNRAWNRKCVSNMEKWLGKVMTIRTINRDSYNMVEDKDTFGGWLWVEEVIEGLANDTDKKIVITVDGKETLAKLYEDGKVVKSAVAKCSPDDEFDFEVGAKIAFGRLIEDKPDKWCVVNRPPKVGDFIRLKETRWSFNRQGDILKVNSIGVGCVKVRECDHPRKSHQTTADYYEWKYLTPNFEVVEAVEKVDSPKYYNGKVVCVKKATESSQYTIGKIYEFIEGRVKIDNGLIFPTGYGVKTLDEWNNDPLWLGKFIPLVE